MLRRMGILIFVVRDRRSSEKPFRSRASRNSAPTSTAASAGDSIGAVQCNREADGLHPTVSVFLASSGATMLNEAVATSTVRGCLALVTALLILPAKASAQS